MTAGQKIRVYGDKRKFKSSGIQGTIIAVEKRYIVVQYKHFRESFLIVEVKNNIDREFELE